ncbi:MAG: hypothetical protein ACPIOQ_76685, partial [Promethearchaeia archaeon]
VTSLRDPITVAAKEEVMCINVAARIHSTDESDTHFDVSHAVLPPRMAWVHSHTINVKLPTNFTR